MNIYLDSIGCRLNQSEIETYARQFCAAGHNLLSSPENAALVVINTCTVTSAAASDSRQRIRQAAHDGAACIVVTGCWSTLEPEKAASLPGVVCVVPNQVKDDLVSDLLQQPKEKFDGEPLDRQLIPGVRLRTRAFIKVQDGCNNRCAYCVTTLARGAARSRPLDDILADIHCVRGLPVFARQSSQSFIHSTGAQEVVLTGVNLGSWGRDLSPPLPLRCLVEALLKDTDLPRVRLSSLEPWCVDARFFSLWQNPRLCRQLHLPLQSGSAAVLRRMARKTTPTAFARLVSEARQAIPEVAVTTDIIVGFPGESDEEFERSLDFVRQMQFSRGHVFAFSPRPGTAAARMPAQVAPAVIKQRSRRMRAVLAESERHYQQQFLGKELPVLWETLCAIGPQGWRLSGLTDNYLRVSALSPKPLWNHITNVRLMEVNSHGFEGVITA